MQIDTMYVVATSRFARSHWNTDHLAATHVLRLIVPLVRELTMQRMNDLNVLSSVKWLLKMSQQ